MQWNFDEMTEIMQVKDGKGERRGMVIRCVGPASAGNLRPREVFG